MTSQHQSLRDGIRAVVAETVAQAIVPLTEQGDVLTGHNERMEAEQRRLSAFEGLQG